MTEIKDKYQQQILFEESGLTNKISENLPEVTQQVIFDNDDIQEQEEQEIIRDVEIDAKPKPRWLWRSAFALFSTLIMIETVEFFISGFEQSPIIASLYGALLLILSLIGGASLLREFRGLRQFKRREKLKSEVKEVCEQDE